MKVTWRNRRNTKTPTKAFDVSDVRRMTLEASRRPTMPVITLEPRPARAATQQ